MQRILLFDWTVGGHHAVYVRRWCEALAGTFRVLAAVPTETAESISRVAADVVPLGEPRPPLDPSRGTRRQHTEHADRELDLLTEVATRTRPAHIVISTRTRFSAASCVARLCRRRRRSACSSPVPTTRVRSAIHSRSPSACVRPTSSGSSRGGARARTRTPCWPSTPSRSRAGIEVGRAPPSGSRSPRWTMAERLPGRVEREGAPWSTGCSHGTRGSIGWRPLSSIRRAAHVPVIARRTGRARVRGEPSPTSARGWAPSQPPGRAAARASTRKPKGYASCARRAAPCFRTRGIPRSRACCSRPRWRGRR